MIIFKRADDISSFLSRQKTLHKIGFVPTMGALHEGHLSLVKQSKEENSITVCSIFVNPTQFNNPDDYLKYPLTLEKDIELLTTQGCTVLFLPSVDEIYPPGYQKKTYDLGFIEDILEGYYRPGHFQGVCQVVDRLLEIVQPHQIYMGQKDYQQCMVIEKLLHLLGKEEEYHLNVLPTIRTQEGLAMSSRNLRLSTDEQQTALGIYKTLTQIKAHLHNSLDQVKEQAINNLEQQGFIVDYVEIADAATLKPATATSKKLVGLIAASLHQVRLIDNMLLN